MFSFFRKCEGGNCPNTPPETKPETKPETHENKPKVKEIKTETPRVFAKAREQPVFTRTYGGCVQTYDAKGQYHSYNDEPAVNCGECSKSWYKYGVVHRDVGPALIFSGRKEWVRDGIYTRDDGPAIEMTDGSYAYFKKGQITEMFRTQRNGNNVHVFCENGKYHRTDGPAVKIGSDEYNFIHGVPFQGEKDKLSNYLYYKLDGPRGSHNLCVLSDFIYSSAYNKIA